MGNEDGLMSIKGAAPYCTTLMEFGVTTRTSEGKRALFTPSVHNAPLPRISLVMELPHAEQSGILGGVNDCVYGSSVLQLVGAVLHMDASVGLPYAHTDMAIRAPPGVNDGAAELQHPVATPAGVIPSLAVAYRRNVELPPFGDPAYCTHTVKSRLVNEHYEV
jgi:hypothetical protein